MLDKELPMIPGKKLKNLERKEGTLPGRWRLLRSRRNPGPGFMEIAA